MAEIAASVFISLDNVTLPKDKPALVRDLLGKSCKCQSQQTLPYIIPTWRVTFLAKTTSTCSRYLCDSSIIALFSLFSTYTQEAHYGRLDDGLSAHLDSVDGASAALISQKRDRYESWAIVGAYHLWPVGRTGRPPGECTY